MLSRPNSGRFRIAATLLALFLPFGFIAASPPAEAVAPAAVIALETPTPVSVVPNKPGGVRWNGEPESEDGSDERSIESARLGGGGVWSHVSLP